MSNNPVINHIEIPDGLIVIQACDNDWANIGIFVDKSKPTRRSAYHHVDVPSLTRNCYEPPKYNDLSLEEFDSVIIEYKERIWALLLDLG